MKSHQSNEFGTLQAVIGAAFIFAFLAAIAFSFQPYSPGLRLRYLAVVVILVPALMLSRFRLVIVASGFVAVALRCVVGLLSTSHHILAFVLGGAASACIAWLLLKASIKRYG